MNILYLINKYCVFDKSINTIYILSIRTMCKMYCPLNHSVSRIYPGGDYVYIKFHCSGATCALICVQNILI